MGMRKVNGSTNPRFFAVTVGLEEIDTFVAVVVVPVQAVHGCFGCLGAWTSTGLSGEEQQEGRRTDSANCEVTVLF
jgi:hypothetical protein